MEDSERWTEKELMKEIKKGLKANETPSELAGRLAKESGWKRREVYKLIAS